MPQNTCLTRPIILLQTLDFKPFQTFLERFTNCSIYFNRLNKCLKIQNTAIRNINKQIVFFFKFDIEQSGKWNSNFCQLKLAITSDNVK